MIKVQQGAGENGPKPRALKPLDEVRSADFFFFFLGNIVFLTCAARALDRLRGGYEGFGQAAGYASGRGFTCVQALVGGPGL